MRYSFIVPVYNAEKWIEKCIEIISNINLQDYEILLIDDGSIDRSPEICDKIACEQPAVQVIHQTNRGVSAARNKGLDHAIGDYILFLDVDDCIDSIQLGEVLTGKALKGNIDMVMFGIAFDHYQHGIYSYSERPVCPLNGTLSIEKCIEELATLYACNRLNSVCTKVFVKKILDQYNIRFNTEMFMYEDLDFVLRYMRRCKNIFNEKRIIYHYRINEEQAHPGERLSRIHSLNQFIINIENSLKNLVNSNGTYKKSSNQNIILIKLYLVLVREKIGVSSPGQIADICTETKAWFEKWPPELLSELTKGERRYLDMLLHKQVAKIILRNTYSWFRHQVAIRYKILKRKEKNGH